MAKNSSREVFDRPNVAIRRQGEKDMDFWSELIKIVVSNGIFAMLFVYLLFYQLKDSQKREQAYRKTIDDLAKHLLVLEEVREEIVQLKEMIEVKNEKL